MGPCTLRKLRTGPEAVSHERRRPQHVVQSVELVEPGLGRGQRFGRSIRPREGLSLHSGHVRGDIRIQRPEVDAAQPPLELLVVTTDPGDPGANSGQVHVPRAARGQRQALGQDCEG